MTLFATKTFSEMTSTERIRACYQHACLQYVSGKALTNSSLRKRFGVSDKNYPMVSKVIKATLNNQCIKRKSDSGSNDHSYIPFWG